jgi:hypothetical protein
VNGAAGSVDADMSEHEANQRNEVVQPGRTPRPGELTNGWRVVTGITWVFVMVALASVWNVSDQLGLSTWWLGPRGRPNSVLVQVLPFVPAALMLLAAANHVRYLPWYGLAASSTIVATGVVDLTRFTGLGIVEIAIGVAAGVVSLASLTGVYRVDPDAVREQPAAPVAPSMSS